MLQEVSIPTSNQVKEEIILAEPKDIESFSQETPELTEITLLNRVISIIKLGVPMAFGDAMALKQMILPVILSHLNNDTDHTAANGAICTMIGMLMVTSISPLFGVNIIGVKLVKELLAAEEGTEEQTKKIKELVDIYRNGLFYSAVAAPVIMTTFYFSESILIFIHQDANVAAISQKFLRPFSISILPTFIYMNTLEILQSFQFTPVMGATSVSFALTLLASIGMGFGIVLPNLGETGILAGYIAEPFVTSLIMTAFLIWHKKFRNMPFFSNLFSSLKGNSRQVLDLIKTGGLITLCVLVDLAMGFSTSAIAGNIGTKEQAALALTMQYQLANSIFAIHFPLSAMIHSGMVLNTKNKNAKDIEMTAKAGIISSMLVGSVIPLFFAIFPQLLTKIAGVDDKEMDKTLKYLAPFMSIGAIFEVLRIVLLFQLRIMNEMRSSTIIFICCQIAGLILSAALGLGTNAGLYGAASGYVFAAFLNSILLSIQLHRRLSLFKDNSSKVEIVQQEKPQMARILGRIGTFPSNNQSIELNEIKLNDNNAVILSAPK